MRTEDVDELYVKAMDLGYVHTPVQSPAPPRRQYDLDQAKKEVEEEYECRKALRERAIPPYFESDIASQLLQSKQVTVLIVTIVIKLSEHEQI